MANVSSTLGVLFKFPQDETFSTRRLKNPQVQTAWNDNAKGNHKLLAFTFLIS